MIEVIGVRFKSVGKVYYFALKASIFRLTISLLLRRLVVSNAVK